MALPLSLEIADLTAPRTWAEVDLRAIKYNVKVLRRHIAPAQFLAVVKANAYGLGAIPIAKAAIEAGAVGLVVASCEDGQELRQAGIIVPILVLGYVPVELAEAAVAHDLTLTVNDPALAKALSRATLRSRRKTTPLPVHFKLDTGMNRYGLEPDEALELAQLISRLPGLTLQGLYTHFATGDEPDRSFVYEQQRRFEATSTYLAQHGFHFPQQHLSSSASGIGLKLSCTNFVRFGLALYGYYPSPTIAVEAKRSGLNLRPSLTLKSIIIRLNDLEPGEAVGYNRTYVATERRRVALVPLGYADGYRRALSNQGIALVGGQRARIIGRISMDQLTLDVTGLPGVREGDEVVFIGSQEGSCVSLEEVADLCDTIPYEIMTGLGRRVKRIYHE
jgi:alanine racemase